MGERGERVEELRLNKAKFSRPILWMLLHWSDPVNNFWWLSRLPRRHVFIFQANLSGPPSESFQSFQRSPLLGSQLRLIPPFVLLQSSDPPKILPPPQGINNDQSLTIEYIHVPEPSSLFRVDSEESHESAHTWLFAIPPKLAKVTKGKSLSTLGARGFSCAVSGFFSRRSCLRPKAEDVSACGRRSSSSLEKKNLWYPG